MFEIKALPKTKVFEIIATGEKLPQIEGSEKSAINFEISDPEKNVLYEKILFSSLKFNFDVNRPDLARP